MKKVHKGKHCVDGEEVKNKTAETLKGIKIDKFKNCSEQWKKHLERCIASKYMKSTLNVTEVSKYKSNFFINKFQGFFGAPLICLILNHF